jgi:hypothetical protein
MRGSRSPVCRSGLLAEPVVSGASKSAELASDAPDGHALDEPFTSFAPADLGNTYRLGLGIGKSFPSLRRGCLVRRTSGPSCSAW